jgi:hypothetical protein
MRALILLREYPLQCFVGQRSFSRRTSNRDVPAPKNSYGAGRLHLCDLSCSIPRMEAFDETAPGAFASFCGRRRGPVFLLCMA